MDTSVKTIVMVGMSSLVDRELDQLVGHHAAENIDSVEHAARNGGAVEHARPTWCHGPRTTPRGHQRPVEMRSPRLRRAIADAGTAAVADNRVEPIFDQLRWIEAVGKLPYFGGRLTDRAGDVGERRTEDDSIGGIAEGGEGAGLESGLDFGAVAASATSRRSPSRCDSASRPSLTARSWLASTATPASATAVCIASGAFDRAMSYSRMPIRRPSRVRIVVARSYRSESPATSPVGPIQPPLPSA